MFEVTPQEVTNLRYQNGTSSWGGIHYNAFAFTELGVAMLRLGESEKEPIPEVGFAAIEKRRHKWLIELQTIL